MRRLRRRQRWKTAENKVEKIGNVEVVHRVVFEEGGVAASLRVFRE